MPQQQKWLRKTEMKKLSEVFSEQHREKGRFKPTVPHMVANKATASPRTTSDSANVSLKERCWPGYKPTPGKKAYAKGSCVKEANAAAIAAATAISKKKSGNYDKEGFRKTPYKNADHPNVKSNEQRRKEMKEDIDGTTEQVAGSAQSTLTDKPNREPMKTYKQKNITELSTELLDRYKDKAAADSAKADKEGNTAKADKRFSGVVKATTKQFDNFKKKGFKEETEQIDEISAQAHKEYQAKARADVKSLAKHTGGEYGDIAKNIMQRRIKGLSTSTALRARDRMAKMNKEETDMNEAIKDKFDIGEYDQEGDMAKSDLRSIMANAKKLHDMIEDADNLPEWCQNKITLAEDYISTVANYLTAEMSEETEIQEDEKKPDDKFKSLAPKDDHHTYYKFVVGKAKMGKPLSQKEKSFANSYRLMRQEEVEQIDELKKATLASYIDKAADSVKSKKDAAANMYRFTKQVTSAMKKSAEGDKRIEGIKSATKRLAKEEIEQIDEKNVPTSPEKWAQAKAQAKAKFDVYPSAYANGWAAKKYKAMGGGWKSVSEETNNLPFTPDKPKKQSVVAGKYGKGYSTARHLARSAMQKQVEKMKKQPIKEESRKAAIVKDIMKKKKGTSDDAFQKEPELSSTLTKVQ
jgi:hypothetical protein